MEFIIGKFISWLKLSILFGPLLDCVICEMHQFITEIIDGVFSARCSQVPLVININLDVPIYWGHENKCPDIEFPSVDEEWVVDILLDNASATAPRGWFFDNISNFIKVFSDLNPVTSVCIFTRFYDPNILGRHRGLIVLNFRIFCKSLCFFVWTINGGGVILIFKSVRLFFLWFFLLLLFLLHFPLFFYKGFLGFNFFFDLEIEGFEPLNISIVQK